MVLVPVGEQRINAALQQAAEKGSPQAAREYRAWLDRYPEQDTTIRPEMLLPSAGWPFCSVSCVRSRKKRLQTPQIRRR
jgi:hypothetical protein